MTNNECLEYIDSIVFAKKDKQGNLITCVIDIMDYDENGLYFLAEKGIPCSIF